MSKRIQSVAALCALAFFGLLALKTEAADKARIQQAIARGAGFIKTKIRDRNHAEKSLSFVALFKAGETAESPLMQEAAAHVLSKFKDGAYFPSADEMYEAGVDATLLADLDGEKYRPQLQIIADYISSNQSSEGHWNYLPPRRSADRMGGDVSVTHYACLGLWAAARAGIKVDPQVWVRVLNWMNTSHNADGGYAYNPGQSLGRFGPDSTLNMSVNGVGIMCIAMLNLEPKRLPSFEKGMATAIPPPAGKVRRKASRESGSRERGEKAHGGD